MTNNLLPNNTPPNSDKFIKITPWGGKPHIRNENNK